MRTCAPGLRPTSTPTLLAPGHDDEARHRRDRAPLPRSRAPRVRRQRAARATWSWPARISASARRASRPPRRWCTWAWRRWSRLVRGPVLPQRLQPRPAAADLPEARRIARRRRDRLRRARRPRARAPTAEVLACEPIPDFLLDMVEAGGLLPQLQDDDWRHPDEQDPEFDLLIKQRARRAPARQRGARGRHRRSRTARSPRWRPGIDAERAKAVYDGSGRLAFPGVVDAHMHSGIYSPLDEDAVSESQAAAMGGVTSSLNYFRTGQYYLNKGGPYAKFFPEVLEDLARTASTSTTATTWRRWTARTSTRCRC